MACSEERHKRRTARWPVIPGWTREGDRVLETARFISWACRLLTDQSDVAPTTIIGASIPRSGHHYLARLLRGYFGPDLKYCRTYSAKDCCFATPCIRSEGRRLVYQKSHDLAFRIPTDTPDALYLIQHRSPVANAMSDAELRRKRAGLLPPRESLSARYAFYDFLAARLAYYKRFHDKWIVSPPERSVIVAHGTLERDPAGELSRIVVAAGEPLEQDRLDAVVDDMRDVGRQRAVYAPRVAEDSAFFEPKALAAYETAIIEHCPAFGYAPTLEPRGYRLHPIWALARLRHAFGAAYPPRRTAEFE